MALIILKQTIYIHKNNVYDILKSSCTPVPPDGQILPWGTRPVSSSSRSPPACQNGRQHHHLPRQPEPRCPSGLRLCARTGTLRASSPARALAALRRVELFDQDVQPGQRKEPFDVYCRILYAYTIIYVNIGFFSASCFFHPFYTGSLSSCGILASSNIHVLYMFSHHTRFIHVMSLYMHYPSACLVGDNR